MSRTEQQEPAGARYRRGPLCAGDVVQLTDSKGRRHMLVLEVGRQFHTHRGAVSHDDLIGGPEGVVATSSSGESYLAFRPLLADYAVRMSRGAAVVYPKDAAQIMTLADVFPGANVVEAGAGSGALKLTGRRVPFFQDLNHPRPFIRLSELPNDPDTTGEK